MWFVIVGLGEALGKPRGLVRVPLSPFVLAKCLSFGGDFVSLVFPRLVEP